MKILYVIENIYFGGGERAFAQIISGLDRGKFEICVACGPDREFIERISANTKIFPFYFRNKCYYTIIRQLSTFMKEKKIQIVHSQGGRADFFARLAAKRAGVPVVISTVAMPVEGYDVGCLKKAIYTVLDRYSEKFADKFIVVSEGLKQGLIKTHKISANKMVKISNGIEVKEYYGHPGQGKNIREELNIEPGVNLVGLIGRLVWQKGLPYFIQAIKEIEAGSEKPEAKYLIVGEGKEKGGLKERVKSLGLDNKIIFTGFRKDIKEILSALDILVLSSTREGQPIIILEAMAMGKAIVATDIEGVNETISNGLTGILVPLKDSFALAETIKDLLKSKDKARELGQAARRAAQEQYNIKDKIIQHQVLYETLIQDKPGVF